MWLKYDGEQNLYHDLVTNSTLFFIPYTTLCWETRFQKDTFFLSFAVYIYCMAGNWFYRCSHTNKPQHPNFEQRKNTNWFCDPLATLSDKNQTVVPLVIIFKANRTYNGWLVICQNRSAHLCYCSPNILVFPVKLCQSYSWESSVFWDFLF